MRSDARSDPKNSPGNACSEWQVYRTRFLIRARQLTEPLSFTDSLGRAHSGDTGDYLVETSDGLRRIAPRAIFEDVYIAMGPAQGQWLAVAGDDAPAIEPESSPRSIALSHRSEVPVQNVPLTPHPSR